MAVYAPAAKLQAYRQFYTSIVLNEKMKRGNESDFNPNCSVWVDWNHQQFCNLQDFKNAFDSTLSWTCQDDSVSCNIYSFDSIYPENSIKSSTKFNNVCFLYFDISKEFMPWHTYLKSLALDKKCTLVTRFIIPSTQKPLYLNGYGVELAIKNTEYKVVDDDRQLKEKSGSESIDLQNSDEFQFLQEKEPRIQKLTSDEISSKFLSFLVVIDTNMD